jgi:hypothetical protein
LARDEWRVAREKAHVGAAVGRGFNAEGPEEAHPSRSSGRQTRPVSRDFANLGRGPSQIGADSAALLRKTEERRAGPPFAKSAKGRPFKRARLGRRPLQKLGVELSGSIGLRRWEGC